MFKVQKNAEESTLRLNGRSLPTLWRLIILTCLVAGIVFRFSNLENKVFQYDETFSSLRVSGYTEAQAVQQLATAGIIGIEDLQKYQQPSPEATVLATAGGLANEEPQLTPLYFVLARFWTERLGGSIAAIRSLSVIASILALPCMYWLCMELFESALASWMGVAILSVSPFQLLYAQEARPNSLWVMTILLSSAALLRAMRVQTPTSWLIYAVTAALNLYAYLFSALVAIAHSIYVLSIERFRINRRTLAFAIALVCSLLAFLPWIIEVLNGLQEIRTATGWTADDRLTLPQIYRLWVFFLNLGFVDFGTGSSPIPKPVLSLVYWFIRLLVLYGFYSLCRHTPPRVWLFILTLTWLPAIGLLLPDLILGGSRSTIPRYLVPVYLGFQLVMTHLLSRQIQAIAQPWRQKLGHTVAAIVLAVGVLSCGLIIQADTWWTKMISNNNPHLAQIINQTDRPLIISDAGLGDLLSISHYLDPKVRLLVRPHCYTTCQVEPAYRQLKTVPYLPPIPAGYSDVFLFHSRPQPTWMNRLKQAKYRSLEVLANKDEEWLWKVKQ